MLINDKQLKYISDLRWLAPDWLKKHFREIENVFYDGNMLFKNYNSKDSLFNEITFIQYLNNYLPQRSNDEIIKDAFNLSELFGGQTINKEYGSNDFFGYTYCPPYEMFITEKKVLNFNDFTQNYEWSSNGCKTIGPSPKIFFNQQDLENISFLTNKQNQNDTTFMISNPAQITKAHIDDIEDAMIDFSSTYLFYIKNRIKHQLLQISTKKARTLWQSRDDLKQIILKQYSKHILFFTTMLTSFTSSLPKIMQDKFIAKLDKDISYDVGFNENDNVILGDDSFTIPDFFTKKQWDDFISNLKKEINEKKDENNNDKNNTFKPKLK